VSNWLGDLCLNVIGIANGGIVKLSSAMNLHLLDSRSLTANALAVADFFFLCCCRFWPVRKYPWGNVEAMLTMHSGECRQLHDSLQPLLCLLSPYHQK
jgi:hypothetical protein